MFVSFVALMVPPNELSSVHRLTEYDRVSNSDASQDALTLVHNSSFEAQHAKDSEYV